MGYVAGDRITVTEYNQQLLSNATLGGYGINHIIGQGELYHGLGEVGVTAISQGQEVT